MRFRKEHAILVIFLMLSLIVVGCGNEVSSSDEIDNSIEAYIQAMSEASGAVVLNPKVAESEEYYDILDRRAEALSENFEWYGEYRENNTFPYPYNEKFGITEQEYNNLHNGTYMSLEETGETDFVCTELENGLFELNIDSDSLKFTIDTSINEITMSSGEILTFSKEVTADKDSQRLTGAWSGYTYTFVESTSSEDVLASYGVDDDTQDIGYENIIPDLIESVDGKLVSITIGKFLDKDEYLIYYRYIDLVEKQANYLLYYIGENTSDATNGAVYEGASYSTLQDAVLAVIAQEDEMLYFEGVNFYYDSWDSYDESEPVYSIFFSIGEVENSKVDLLIYTVDNKISEPEEYFLTKTVEEHEKTKNSDIDESIDTYSDRTHLVVDMAKERGRDLADEAFGMNYSLTGSYNGRWFYLFINGNNFQAAYNIDTEELVLSDDIDSSLSIENNEPVENLD